MLIIIAAMMGLISGVLYLVSKRVNYNDEEGFQLLSSITGAVAGLCVVFSIPLAFNTEIKSLEDSQTAIQTFAPEFSNVKLECGVASPTFKGTMPIKFTYKNATFQVPYALDDNSEAWGSICSINVQNATKSMVDRLKAIQREVRSDIQATLNGQEAIFEKERSSSVKYSQYLAKVDNAIKATENSEQIYVLAPESNKNTAYRVQRKTNVDYSPVIVPASNSNKTPAPPAGETQAEAQQLLLQNISGQ